MPYISNHLSDIAEREIWRAQLASDAEAWLATHEPTVAPSYRKPVMTPRERDQESWVQREVKMADGRHAKEKAGRPKSWPGRDVVLRLMAKHGINKTDLAHACHINRPSVTNYLKGASVPPLCRQQVIEAAVVRLAGEGK